MFALKYGTITTQCSVIPSPGSKVLYVYCEVMSDMYIVKPSIKHGAVENVSGG